MIALHDALKQLVEGQALVPSQVEAAFEDIMAGAAPPAQIAGFLVALRMKGETPAEVAAAARAMGRAALRIEPQAGDLIDTCGTGGDGLSTFNISTASSLVVAGAGAPVAKHGNRSVSSRSGSADVLEALGVRIDLTPPQVCQSIEEVGYGFLFAPSFHPAMRHAGPVRRELAIRTLFNILGPLVNPASPRFQLLGVPEDSLLEPMAFALAELGLKRAAVVCGDGRMDEIALSGPTRILFVEEGTTRPGVLTPEDLGLATHPLEDLAGGTAEANARLIEAILEGSDRGPRRDVVLANAGVALHICGRAATPAEGVEAARYSLESGEARECLARLVAFTQGLRESA